MIWLVAALYALGVAGTWWLCGHVLPFEMVCVDDRGRMAVVWPMTWLAALCVALLIGTATVHGWIIARDAAGES